MFRFNQLWQMTLLTLRQMMRNKIAFFFSLIMPLIFLIIFGLMNGGSNTVTSIKIGLIDQDGGPTAQMIQQALNSSGLYEISTGNEQELLRRLDAGGLRAIIQLPDGISTPGQAPSEILIHFDPTSGSSAVAQGGLHFLIQGLAADRSNTPLFTTAAKPIESTQTLGLFDFMMPGMLVYMLLNAGVIAMAIQVSFQRKQGTLRHMFSTPLTVGNWVIGSLLGNLLLAVLQLGLISALGYFVFKVQPPANLLGTFVILFLSSLAGFSIGLMIGAITKGPEATQPIALILSMALTFLGNAMIPLDGGPRILTTIMKFMPSYYMTHSLQRVMMKGQGLETVLLDLGVLAATAALALSFASWRLRRLFVTAG